jgi:hypothetical protein
MLFLFSPLRKQLHCLLFHIIFQIGGVSIANQSFAIISSANGFNGRQSDGLLGMGYEKIATGGENPVVWSMYLAGELSLPIFGFWFGP